MRTTVDLPEPLLENAKRQAAALNVTLSELVQDGLLRVLNDRIPEAGNNFKLLTFGAGGLVDPNKSVVELIAKMEEDDDIHANCG